MDRAGLTHSWNGRLIRENAAVRGRLQWSRVGSHGDASGPHFPGVRTVFVRHAGARRPRACIMHVWWLSRSVMCQRTSATRW
jgi:hypothetical protein